MKNDIYRNRETVDTLVQSIAEQIETTGPVKFMHVCGSHERTASEWALRDLLPKTLQLISGPGCPVCVCAEHEIGEVIKIAEKDVCIISFGDMLRIKTKYGSLMESRTDGADIRVVYSPDDAVQMAKKEADREFVFFAIGFETSAAPLAGLFAQELPDNFSVLTSLKLTSPAVEALVMNGGSSELNGLVAPGHVATIVGSKDWERFPEKYKIPVTVAGFEPVDLLAAIKMLLHDVEKKQATLRNQYDRLVKYQGNILAKKWMNKVFAIKKTFWRALGWVAESGLFLTDRYASFDARKKYDINLSHQAESTMPKGCICHLVVLGKSFPSDCPLFGKKCNLMEPVGPCMVSEEGACRIWQQFSAL